MPTIVSSLFWLGCGAATSDSGGSDYTDQDFDGGVSVEADATLGPGEGDIESTWARRHVMAGIAELPAFGPKTNLTVTLGKVSVLRTASGFMAREETCDVQIVRPEVTEITTVIPDAFRASIATIDRPLYIDQGQWIFEQAIQVQGAHLVNPHAEALPTDAEDPRVYDQDQDGLPGVTVLIEGIIDGTVQVVQRTRTRMVGIRQGARIAGALQWSSEESIIAANDPILENDVPLTPSPNPAESDFVAVEITADVTCEDIRNMGDSLFSP